MTDDATLDRLLADSEELASMDGVPGGNAILRGQVRKLIAALTELRARLAVPPDAELDAIKVALVSLSQRDGLTWGEQDTAKEAAAAIDTLRAQVAADKREMNLIIEGLHDQSIQLAEMRREWDEARRALELATDFGRLAQCEAKLEAANARIAKLRSFLGRMRCSCTGPCDDECPLILSLVAMRTDDAKGAER